MTSQTRPLSALPLLGLLITSLSAFSTAQAAETRCGWLQNPTPGNWWLDDRDASWTIRTQGPDDGPPGMDRIPDITTRDFVATNGAYGYGCACLSVSTDTGDSRITTIFAARQLPIATCRADKALPLPEE